MTIESVSTAVDALDTIGGRINLVFHDIVDGGGSSNRYTVTLERFDQIIGWLVATGLARRSRLYFDDNFISCHQMVVHRPDLEHFDEVVIAVPAVSMLERGYGDWNALDRARDVGLRIAAHGYQHVRLASYHNGILLDTPLGGRYQPVGPGHHPDDVLAENEVLYQLVEAYEALAKVEPIEFVLPYGCFNRATVALNDRLALYETLATSDFDLDIGQQLRPRYLIEATTTPDQLQAVVMARIGATE